MTSIACPFVLSLLLPAGDDAHRPLQDAPRFVADAEAFARSLLGAVDVVPGFGLAVVVEDKIVLADGYGMADRERKLEADGDTLYYIASATKPFTVLMASILDARGEIELGSPLADYLDEGQLAPELAADQILLRDLLCHTSGLDNGPITFRLAYSGEHDPELLWKLVARTTANKAGRGKFQYTNYGCNLLTIVLERELKKRWQDLLQEELFGPLGLTHTSAYVSAPRAKGFTLAAPYRGSPQGLRRVELEKRDEQMQSAGGMLTSPRDAARWLSFQLNPGVLDGRAVVDPALVRATHEEWVRIDAKSREGTATACGGGWMIDEYAGRRMLQHGGGYPGFRATITFMPEARVGVAVFVNSDFGDAADALRAWAYDWWLGRATGDPAARIEPMAIAVKAGLAGFARSVAEREGREWQLSRERAAYAGTYVNELMGTLVVDAADEAIRVKLGLLECLAEPYPQADAMRLELVPGSGRVAQFELGKAGRATAVDYEGVRFERRAD